MDWTKKNIDDLTYQIIGAAISVHEELGPGLLEKVYHECMFYELKANGIKASSEHNVDVIYRGLKMNTRLRCDLLIEDAVVAELKSVKEMPPMFDAQLVTYMKLLKKPKGILINFNVPNIFKNGQRTIVNEIYRDLPNE